MRLSLLPFVFLIVPIAEIATFVLVGGKIGVLPTIGLVIATAIAGATLVRVQGFGIVNRIRTELEAGRVPGRELANGVMVLLAGFLLLTPGFITDTLGLLLFVPAIRNAVWSFLGKRIVVTGMAGGPFQTRREPPHRGAGTIDLGPEDFSAEPSPKGATPPSPPGQPPSPWKNGGGA